MLKLMRDHVPAPAPTPRGGTGLGKDEVNKLVQEALAATHEENAERNAQVIGSGRSANFATVWTQILPIFHFFGLKEYSSFFFLISCVCPKVQSLITEVQNIIGQTREVGTQCRELTDKASLVINPNLIVII